MHLLDTQAVIMQSYLLNQTGLLQNGHSMIPWQCYVDSMPDDPDYALSISDCKGKNFGRLQRGDTVEHFGVDFIIRSGQDFRVGQKLGLGICAMADALHNAKVVIGTNIYWILSMYRIAPQLISMGEEPLKRRQMFSVDFNLVILPGGTMTGIGYTDQNTDQVSYIG